MRRKTFLRWVRHRAKLLLAIVAVSWLAIILLTIHLSAMMPGPNHYELAAIARLAGSVMPWNHAIDAPYYLIAKIADIFLNPLMALRVTSVMFGLATAALLCYVIRQWFGDRVAVVGVLLIVTSSWFLHLSRIGAPFIAGSFFLTALIALGTWRTYATKPVVVDTLLLITLGLSMYIPYFLWLFILGLVVFLIKKNRQLFRQLHVRHWTVPIVILFSVVPLILAILHQHDTLRELLGLQSLSNNGIVYTDRLIENVWQLFFHGQYDPSLLLGRLPLLDVFSNVMVGLGLYYFERRLMLRRGQFMLGGTLVLLTVISLSVFSVAHLAVLFPLIMLFVIGGVVELLNRWLDSFPRNPIARSIGVVMLVIAIGFTSFYHLQRYFVAWGNYPDAVNAHRQIDDKR